MVTRVVLPRVIMHSRYHYGAFSENFTGLELEDGGGRGTSGSHWEKRLLMNEIMTGSVDTRSVVSAMTLALLEDSGWYKANYSMADRLDWGRNQGTEFVTLPCNQWKGAYHCNNTQLSGCTYNREAEGYCPIVSYSGDLPQWARYFPQANKGGQSSLADYCTYFVAYSDGSCTDTNSARAPDRMLGEVRGSNSRCMASSLVRTGFVRGSMTQGNGCYQHRCLNNTLEVAVDGTWKACPEAGGPIQFSGFNGELMCPAYHELCSTSPPAVSGQCPNSCSFNGDCMNGRCLCFLGFHGHDCSKRSCPSNCGEHGKCLANGVCSCENGYAGIDCSTAVCDEQCSLHGGVCNDGVCEFRCSDYAGYTCQNSSALLSSLSVCKDVLQSDSSGQHCAPSEPSILQQLEEVVVMPNYHSLFPTGARKLFNIFGNGHCDEAAKRLACWISIQKCDKDGDNRLRVCYSACHSYNVACGASLDCSDQTLFSSVDEGDDQCTGAGEVNLSWFSRLRAGIHPTTVTTTSSSMKGATEGKERCHHPTYGFGSCRLIMSSLRGHRGKDNDLDYLVRPMPSAFRKWRVGMANPVAFHLKTLPPQATTPVAAMLGISNAIYAWIWHKIRSGKNATDPRSRSVPGVPDRPSGQRPQTAPPPPQVNHFGHHGFEFTGGWGGFACMATTRLGSFAFSATIGGLIPSWFNVQMHQGSPNAAMYEAPTEYHYGQS
ncbi:Leishmanolysin-like peptidase-like protein [Drosera capensis]